MGCFDSLFINCPVCNHELEFQSKSGSCGLCKFTKDDLPIEVAVGLNHDVVHCQFCNNKFQIVCEIPEFVNVNLFKVNKNKNTDYAGNYNADLPENIKKINDLRKMLKGGK